MNIGIIGVGGWGKNYLRILNELLDSSVICCADANEEALKYAKETYPSVKIFDNYLDLIEDESIEAICVVTNATSHYKISKDVLLADKHVLVEKPITINSKEAEDLIKLAERKEKIIMVGHTYIFNSYIRKLKEIISSNQLGKIFHFNFTRCAPGPVRSDVNCIFDLAPHDVSIIQYLLDKNPIEVCAVGQSYLQKNIEDVAFISLKYPDDIFVNISVSWFYPNKVRKAIVIGNERLAIFDDTEKIEKLRLFSKEGNVVIPDVLPSEPLKNECAHFIDCLRHGNKPLTDGKMGLDVVKILEYAQDSIEKNSKFIKVKI
jgi:predicted dehydrogenase